MHLVEHGYIEPLNSALSPMGMSSSHERMLRLGGPALAEAAAAAPEPAPLYLALPEAVPGAPGSQDADGRTFIQQLAVQAGIAIDEKRSIVYRLGGAGPLFALLDALKALTTRRASTVIVGGVDTFLALRRIGALDSEGRLLGRSTRTGFIPGEGAGFLLLRAAQSGQRGQLFQPPAAPVLARIVGVGTGMEKGHRYSKEPYRGDGLAEAFEDLFERTPPNQPKARCVYAGFNGEDMPAKEWGVSRLRNSDRFAEELQVEHPADCIGDAGAALLQW